MEWSLILLKLKILVLSLVLALVFICVVPPIFILHYCVNTLSKLLRPDLDSIVRPQDAGFCKDYEKWHVRPVFNITVCTYVDCCLSMTECRSRLNDALTHDYKFRKLRQRIEKWMGFLFWKNDEDFRIEDHVKYYPGEEEGKTVRDKKWILKAMQDLLNKPFIKDKSPWEVLWVPRFKCDIKDEKECSIVIINYHHSIGDGYVAIRTYEQLFGISLQNLVPNFSSPKMNTIIKKLIDTALFLLKTPYVVAEITLTRQDRNKTPWNSDSYKFQYKSICAEGKRISVDYMKSIKNKFNVSFSSVLLLGMSSLIRNAFIQAKIKLPNVVHCMLPLPVPNRPDELCCHSTAVLFRFPVGISDPEMRLKAIEEELLTLKNSLYPKVMFLMGEILGRMPFIFIKQPTTFISVAGNVIIVPVVTQFPDTLYRTVNCLSVPGALVSSGFFICCSTHNNVLDVITNFDKSIFGTSEEVEQLYESMYQEFKQLSESEIDFAADSYY